MNRKLIGLAAACGLLLLAACGGRQEENVKQDNAPAADSKAALSKGKTDPVCEMEFDTSWVDHSVYNGDTIWFCSETCMSAFTGNPGKYIH